MMREDLRHRDSYTGWRRIVWHFKNVIDSGTEGLHVRLAAIHHRALGTELTGIINTWPLSGPPIIFPPNNEYQTNLASVPSIAIPAGYKLTITLGNDASGNINSVHWVVIDNHGAVAANFSQAILALSGITEADLAPIVAFELNLVGPVNSESAVLRQNWGKFEAHKWGGFTGRLRPGKNGNSGRPLFPKSHLPVSVCYLLLEKLSNYKSLIPLSDCPFVLNRLPVFLGKYPLFPGKNRECGFTPFWWLRSWPPSVMPHGRNPNHDAQKQAQSSVPSKARARDQCCGLASAVEAPPTLESIAAPIPSTRCGQSRLDH